MRVHAILLLLLPNLVLAQQSPLAPGQRVRVTAPTAGLEKLVGTLSSIDQDAVVLIADSTVRLPLAGITRLEVSSGRRSHVLVGMAVGLVTGVLTGALIGGLVDCRESFSLAYERDCVVVGAVGGGILGLGSGALIGLVARTDRWEHVPTSRFSFRSTRQLGRGGLGLVVVP